MNNLFDTLNSRMAERGHDKRFPGAVAALKHASAAYSEIRAVRDSVRADKNLSAAGQRSEIMEYLEKAAPALQKQRRMIDHARKTIEMKRAGMRPKFEKVEPAVLVAVAAKISAMPQHEKAALFSVERGVDPINAQAVLELPPILTGVDEQIRTVLQAGLIEKTYGPALATLEDETEAWSIVEAALRTAQSALHEAGDFPSPHAFDLWLEKVAPPDAAELAAEKRESDDYASEAILITAEGLSHAARMKLHSDLLDQATDYVNRGGE